MIYTSKGSVFPTTTRNVTTAADTFTVVLNDLFKYTEYDIMMTAITIADGNRTLPIVARTDSDSKFDGRVQSGTKVIEKLAKLRVLCRFNLL